MCLRGHSPPLCSGSVTPDALLQSCPSLNQLVSGSVNVTARLPQQQSPDVGGRLAGEKRKKNPSSQKKNPSSQPCCCSNQAPSRLLLSNVAPCPSSPLSLFNPPWLTGIRPNLLSFPAGLVPSVTQCEQSPLAAQGGGTLSCCSLQKMNCSYSKRQLQKLSFYPQSWADFSGVRPEAQQWRTALAIVSECCQGCAGAHGWLGMGLLSIKHLWFENLPISFKARARH